MLCVKSAL